jgi:hypothetical protein
VSHVLVLPTGLACVSGTDFNAESSSTPGGRIGTAENDFGRRRILRLLGDAALKEHACRVLTYRRRAVEHYESVKLS